MRETIIEMAGALRRAGWPVSTGELVDFLQAFPLVDFRREDVLAAALCTLAKDKESREYLTALFNRYVDKNEAHDKTIPPPVDARAVLANPPRLPEDEFADRLDELKDSIRREIMSQAPGTSRGGRGSTGGFTGTPGFSRGKMAAGDLGKTEKIPGASPWAGIPRPAGGGVETKPGGDRGRRVFHRRSGSAQPDSTDPGGKQHTLEFSPGLHGEGESKRSGSAGPHMKSGNTQVAPRPAPTRLQFMDLTDAGPEQLDEIRKLLGALGKRLAVKKGYRRKPSPSGTVDMGRTVRSALARGGVPLVIKRERRVPSSPLLVTLCDLSGSVAPYSEFFLQLLTGLRRGFRDLHAYAFVDHVEEVTGLISNPGDSWAVSARRILREALISLTGFSNYGRVWELFHDHYRDVLTPRTTLIILGDARNNWHPDGADIFHSITELCRRTIWLNPLPREEWDKDDCIINLYQPHCSSVQECRNAFHLSRVIREII